MAEPQWLRRRLTMLRRSVLAVLAITAIAALLITVRWSASRYDPAPTREQRGVGRMAVEEPRECSSTTVDYLSTATGPRSDAKAVALRLRDLRDGRGGYNLRGITDSKIELYEQLRQTEVSPRSPVWVSEGDPSGRVEVTHTPRGWLVTAESMCRS